MKLFLVSLLVIQAVVLYYLDYTRFKELILWKDSVLEPKYSLILTTSDSYGPKKSSDSDEDEISGYLIPIDLSKDLQYEDAYELYNIKSLQSCIPDTFGYASEQSELVFPHRVYPRCIEKYAGFEVPEILVDLNTDIFTIDCKNTTDIEYFMGPAGKHNFTTDYESVADLQIKYYEGPVHMPSHIEFVMAKCGKDAEFDLGTMVLRKNEKLYEDYTRGRDKDVKPILIAYIVLDSFSRRHFYQKLPETVKLLNSLNENSSYEVHDFKLHNIIGDGSAENILPVLTDQYDKLLIRPDYDMKYRDVYFWNNLADKVFITLIGTEACKRRFYKFMGKNIETHHILSQFYCGAQHIEEYSYKKSATDQQRCIGPHMSHVYGFNYIQQFVETYPEDNKWFILIL